MSRPVKTRPTARELIEDLRRYKFKPDAQPVSTGEIITASQTITFRPMRPGDEIRSLMGGGIHLGEVGDVPCDTDAHEPASGVKAPDRDR